METMAKVMVEMTKLVYRLSAPSPKHDTDILPNEAQRRRIGKSFDVVTGMWDFGGQVELYSCFMSVQESCELGGLCH